MRVMNVMTIHSTLGPMIRMMTLMAFGVAQCLAMLFIFLMGFAGTCHVWFRHVPGDGAADMEDLRVNENDYNANANAWPAAGCPCSSYSNT